jgi:hypothetical protein
MPKLTFTSARAFDAGLAAFAAVSAGFVAFAMPDALFAGLVDSSRLPDVLPAARPPLGDTARVAALGAAALFTFAGVWALMAYLGRTPVRPEAVPSADAPAQRIGRAEAPAPRIRRADAHPDAPPRPPLLARDLGEPLDLEEPAEPETTAEQPSGEAELRPLPAFLVPQEPELLTSSEVEEVPGPEPDLDPSGSVGPAFEPDPEPEAEPEARSIAALAAQLPDVEEQEECQPLSQLVNRIEFGLSRKRQALPPVDLPVAEEPIAESERVGHRLRSAINDLQKIASGGA